MLGKRYGRKRQEGGRGAGEDGGKRVVEVLQLECFPQWTRTPYASVPSRSVTRVTRLFSVRPVVRPALRALAPALSLVGHPQARPPR